MAVVGSNAREAPAERINDLWSSPRVLPAIALLAIALRAVMAVRTSVMFEDGPHFIEVAARFSNGDIAGALAHPYHPLYSALIALVSFVTGNVEVAALAISILGGTVAVVATYIFLRDAFDERVAAFGSLLFAISPYAVRFTADVQSEGLYLAFFVSGVALLYRGVTRDDTPLLIAAGFAAGLAYLTRPEGAGLIAVGGIVIGQRFVSGRLSFARAAKSAAALCGSGLVVAAPYLWALAENNTAVLSGKKSLFRTMGLTAEATASWWILGGLLLLALAFGLRVVRRREPFNHFPAGMIAATLMALLVGQLAWAGEVTVFASVLVSTLRPEIAVLVVLGLVALRRTGTAPRDTFIAVALILYAAVLVGLLLNYGYLSRRHVMPLLPLALGYAGIGAVFLTEAIADRFFKPGADRRAGVLIVGLAALLVLGSAPKTLHDHREDVVAQRLAAEWLKEQDLAPGRVASNKRRTGYYANRPWRSLTRGSALRQMDELARERVRYIVADDRELGYRDHFPPTPGFALQELHRVSRGGRSAMVFELLPQDIVVTPNIAIRAGPPADETH